jgi:hypothetical protein
MLNCIDVSYRGGGVRNKGDNLSYIVFLLFFASDVYNQGCLDFILSAQVS